MLVHGTVPDSVSDLRIKRSHSLPNATDTNSLVSLRQSNTIANHDTPNHTYCCIHCRCFEPVVVVPSRLTSRFPINKISATRRRTSWLSVSNDDQRKPNTDSLGSVASTAFFIRRHEFLRRFLMIAFGLNYHPFNVLGPTRCGDNIERSVADGLNRPRSTR